MQAFSSIKSRVVAVASAIVVLGIWALALRVTASLQDDLRALVAAHLEGSAAYVARDLDRGLQLRIATLRGIAAGMPAEAVADPAEAQRRLERSSFSPSLFSAGFVVANAQGVTVADYPGIPGRTGSSIAERQYFRDAMRGADLAISEPLVGRFLKQPVVTFAVPIRDATGLVAGVLAHSISATDTDLFGPIAGSRIGRSGEVFAISGRDRMVVAATDPSRAMQALPPRGADALLDRRVDEGFEGAGVAIDSRGNEMLGVARRLKSTGWIVIATIPTSEAYAPISTLKRQIYLAALLLSVGVALILRALLARQLAPLEEASAAIRRMTGGGQALAPIPVRRDDEVGELLRSFNRLAEDRARAEGMLREREQRIRALVELSSDWYWQTDADHRFTYREGAVLGRMGLPTALDIGRTRWEIGYPNMTEAGWRAHREILDRHEEFRDLLLERVSPDGRHNWATISGRPLFDDAGAFIGYHGTGRDITAQVEAQQALQQLNAELERKVAERTAELAAANRELEAFSYSVSHDLRTPLRGIDGFSQVLLDQQANRLDADAQRLLGRIRAAAQRTGRLITDLLALSKVTRSAVQPEDVDLSALAAQVVEDLAAEA